MEKEVSETFDRIDSRLANMTDDLKEVSDSFGEIKQSVAGLGEKMDKLLQKL